MNAEEIIEACAQLSQEYDELAHHQAALAVRINLLKIKLAALRADQDRRAAELAEMGRQIRVLRNDLEEITNSMKQNERRIQTALERAGHTEVQVMWNHECNTWDFRSRQTMGVWRPLGANVAAALRTVRITHQLKRRRKGVA